MQIEIKTSRPADSVLISIELLLYSLEVYDWLNAVCVGSEQWRPIKVACESPSFCIGRVFSLTTNLWRVVSYSVQSLSGIKRQNFARSVSAIRVHKAADAAVIIDATIVLFLFVCFWGCQFSLTRDDVSESPWCSSSSMCVKFKCLRYLVVCGAYLPYG